MWNKGTVTQHEVLCRHLPRDTEKKHKMAFRIVDSLAAIRTWYFQERISKRYSLSQLAQWGFEMLVIHSSDQEVTGHGKKRLYSDCESKSKLWNVRVYVAERVLVCWSLMVNEANSGNWRLSGTVYSMFLCNFCFVFFPFRLNSPVYLAR